MKLSQLSFAVLLWLILCSFWLSYDLFWPQIIDGPSLNLPPHLYMWSDQSEAQTGRQQMRMEVDEKIKVESNISILNPECVCVCISLTSFLLTAQAGTHWSWSGREIREKRVTSEGMQRRKGQKKIVRCCNASSISVQAYQLGVRRERWSKQQVALPQRESLKGHKNQCTYMWFI